ncbi:hypothetical protein O181_068214 [Austropuccinia psidii MF-1]|uniref:DDE Tnp4 domain-containing protein n=1 Tax=Austropuccinia psidii MF-1 TaxID=1389203 RepID=A0A9Q3EWV0_9BASI|nr:hypothetical protein [Austropuccinia psidii MF-1]
MPKALQRLPLLQTLNTLQLINELTSDSDSDIQEDIILLDMITSQRYINPHRRYPSRYMYMMNDLQTLSSEKFQQLCRTTHESFEKFVAQIQADKMFQNSSQNKQHNPAIQLAVALSRLGSNGNGAALGKIGMLFGISHGVIVLYTQRVIQILMKLKCKVIVWPTIEQREMSQVMQAEGFPGCIGFIDGSLIPLLQRPPKDGEAYFDCKKRYSMSIQLVCDINKQFTALHAGCTGSLHDANVYQNIKIAQTPEEFYEKEQYLLADLAYASSPWVVPAYKGAVAQNEDNHSFNYCLAKSRVRIKHTIGILKVRCLSLREMQNQMRDNHEIEYFVSWVISCTMLHNMLAQIGDEWFYLYEDDDPPNEENLSNNEIGEDVVNMCEKIKPIPLAWKDSQF